MATDPPVCDAQTEADRQTAGLAGIAVTLLLIALGLGVVHQLHAVAKLEDCLLAGRLVCGAIVAP